LRAGRRNGLDHAALEAAALGVAGFGHAEQAAQVDEMGLRAGPFVQFERLGPGHHFWMNACACMVAPRGLLWVLLGGTLSHVVRMLFRDGRGSNAPAPAGVHPEGEPA
jgi:hypothetical protein